MGINGISWVGNIYQKFEDMCLEVDEITYGDTIEYIENQVQNVGKNFKKFYSDIMQDLVPSSSCDSDLEAASELPVTECPKETTVNVSAPQPTKDSEINNDVYGNDLYASSYNGYCKTDYSSSRQDTGSMLAESNLGVDEAQEQEIPSTETLVETTSLDIEPFAAEITQEENLLDCRDEIENASVEEIPDVPVSVKWDEEKEIDMSPSSSPLLCDELFDATESDAFTEQGNDAMQADSKLNLYNSCVLVGADEVQSVPKAADNQMSYKKKLLKAYFLRKKFSRKQEYEQLAVCHGNMAKFEGDCVENAISTSASSNQKHSPLSEICRSDWELV